MEFPSINWYNFAQIQNKDTRNKKNVKFDNIVDHDTCEYTL